MARNFNINQNEFVLVANCKPQFEYFCTKCLQLRLSFDEYLLVCGNCGNPIVDCVRGNIGELNKENLIKCYSKKD